MEIKDRISYVISSSGIKKVDFAKRINISPASVSQLCSGITNPSNQTIAAICREFGVDRIWLETGAGEPFRPVDRNEQSHCQQRHCQGSSDPRFLPTAGGAVSSCGTNFAGNLRKSAKRKTGVTAIGHSGFSSFISLIAMYAIRKRS